MLIGGKLWARPEQYLLIHLANGLIHAFEGVVRFLFVRLCGFEEAPRGPA
jgi:hypothetical protein